jgi:hypothetical protein
VALLVRGLTPLGRAVVFLLAVVLLLLVLAAYGRFGLI